VPTFDDTTGHARYAPIIGDAVDALAARPRVISETGARAIVARAVHEAREAALAEAASDLYDADAAGLMLGIGGRMVRRIAAERGLGARLGEKTWVFRAADIEAMRDRAPRGPKPRRR
jgi:hypothetical protein